MRQRRLDRGDLGAQRRPVRRPVRHEQGGGPGDDQSLAAEWGRHGIRLNAIAPGEIPTEGMSKRLNPGQAPGAETKAANPMGRVGRMEELQNLAAFLLSDGCDWLTGETIAMDGAQGLATGGNFYQLRQWGDANGRRRALRSRRRTHATRGRGGDASFVSRSPAYKGEISAQFSGQRQYYWATRRRRSRRILTYRRRYPDFRPLSEIYQVCLEYRHIKQIEQETVLGVFRHTSDPRQFNLNQVKHF